MTKTDRLEAKKELEPLTYVEQERLAAVEARLKNADKEHARRYMRDTLQRHLGARFLKPQRIVQLTFSEEHHRDKCTWQLFDRLLFLMTSGEAQYMRKHFAVPSQALANLRQGVLLLSDQAPFWIKIGQARQLYMRSEMRKKKKGSRPS